MDEAVATRPATGVSLVDETERESPMILRLAGLPVETLERLSSGLGDGAAAELRRLASELREARRDLVEALFEAVNGAPKKDRRFLLKVKRDAYNQRSILRHRDHELWSLVESAAKAPAERALALEAESQERLEAFRDLYAAARQSELYELLEVLEERNFRHGLAVGSRSLSLNVDRLAKKPVERFGRKERKAEEGLLRYVTRVANKLSPFSTFTRLALAVAEDRAPEEKLPTLRSRPWREHTQVLFRRNLMEQYVDLLIRHRASVREGLAVRVNESVTRLEDGRYAFVRPGGWAPRETEDGEWVMASKKPELVRARLGGALIEYLVTERGNREMSRRALVDLVVERFAADDEAAAEHLEQTLEKLLEIGFLRRVWPWPSDVPELDRFFLEYLETLDDDELEPLRRDLRELREIRDGFSTDDAPAKSVERVRRLADRMWRTTLDLCGLEVQQKNEAGESYFFYEDVFLAPAPGEEAGGIWGLPREPLERAVASLRPLVRVDNLVSRRHDVLRTLGAAAAKRWPSRSRIGFMDFLAETQPLWQQYFAWEREVRNERDTGHTWNPFGLEVLDELRKHRERVTAEIYERRDAADGRDYLTAEWLESLCDSVPDPAAGERDFCAFLQPLDERGETFVLNDLFEGAGRHGSRYTWAMDDASRELFTGHFERRGRRFELDGEPAELLDILCPGGNYINVHHRQTPRILEIPGERSSCEDEHLLRLCDLSVELRGEGELPRLVDPDGVVLAPANLCPLLIWFMPTLLKFLSVFGTGTMRHMVLGQPTREEGDLRVSDPLWLGNVLIQRRRWQFSTRDMKRRLEGLDEAGAFAEIDAWREARGIPRRVFYSEPFANRFFPTRLKPQYLDFDSPLCVEIFRRSLDDRFDWLGFEELAPGPEAMPADASGRRFAAEIQLDSVAL